jgi:hypothetical protein
VAPCYVSITKHEVVSSRAVRTAQAVLLLATAAGRFGVQIPVGARFSVPVHTGIEAYATFYALGTRTSPGLKRPGCGAGSGCQ